MRNLERLGEAEERLSPAERRRVVRAAFLRPMSLLMVVIGTVFFALTLVWWAIPLTLGTYAALVFLAARDPLFESAVLEGAERRPRIRPGSPEERNVSPPEQRARRLPRGETRQRVEAALEVQRRVLFAIEESSEVARAALGDATTKLHHVTKHLVDIAEKREKAAGAIRDLETSAGATNREGRGADLEELKRELRAADAEISDALKKLLTLRARVVRVSTESGGAAQDAAVKLNADLDELNLRLDALRSKMSPSEPPER